MLYIDRMPVTGGKFPNREVYVDFDELKKLDCRAPHEILCKFESNDDLMALMLYKRSMDDLGFRDISLFIPYLPYAALDRTEDRRCLGAKFSGEFINALNFQEVYTWEAHSNVILATTNRVRDRLVSLDIAREVTAGLAASGVRDILYVFPDEGARKRYQQLKPKQYVVFSKARRFADGSLMEPTVAERHVTGNPSHAIVIDDLCRGGRTTCNAARVVKEKMGVKTVLFCVAHTEDTVYTGPILDDPNVDAIYTTDSCLTRVDHGKLHIVRTILSSRAGEAA